MDILKARQQLLTGQTIYDMTLKVADYGRVSTDKDDQLNSLDNQINYFNDLISNVKNWTHIKSYIDEGISGTQVNKREQFLEMIEDARSGKIDLILTKEVSRFARNTVDSIEYTQLLLQYGVAVFFVSDNINTIFPDSEFRLTLMASMAQDEVRKLSERVKFGIRRSIKDGKLGGSSLLGYDKKEGRLIINKHEAPIVKMLFNFYATGDYGFTKIAHKLAEHGYYTKKGKIFSNTTLKKMLTNYRYKGYYTANLSTVEDYKTHKKKINPPEEWIIYKDSKGHVPAIVSEELWNRANDIYNERNNKWNKNALNKENYLIKRNYTSKIFCKEHNTTFIRYASCKRKENPVWQCNEYLRHGIKGCRTPILYEKDLDEIFVRIIDKLFTNKEILYNNIINSYQKIIAESRIIDLSTIEDKLTEQRYLKDKLVDMRLRGLIDDDTYIMKREKIEKEISTLSNSLKDLQRQINSTTYNDNIIEDIKAKLKNKMSIRNNIGKYFNIFIDKVLISKINEDRKHIKLDIIFNFDHPSQTIEIDLHNHHIIS